MDEESARGAGERTSIPLPASRASNREMGVVAGPSSSVPSSPRKRCRPRTAPQIAARRAIQTFLNLPDEWRRLAERPELAEAAVEEVMRLNPTVTWVTREAVEDFTFQGLEIEKGTTIHLFSQAAGSDPRVFENAGFDPEAERPHFDLGGH
jgi:hypothetical protein